MRSAGADRGCRAVGVFAVAVGLKPSDDGRALILRLFNTGPKEQLVKLNWSGWQPRVCFLTDTSEARGKMLDGRMSVRGFGLVSLRAELN